MALGVGAGGEALGEGEDGAAAAAAALGLAELVAANVRWAHVAVRGVCRYQPKLNRTQGPWAGCLHNLHVSSLPLHVRHVMPCPLHTR